MKKISVIIPCYNAERTIEKCAGSLVGQTIGLEALQLIFVDDASTDRTYEWLCQLEQQYPQTVTVIHLEENMRQGAARNIGLEYAEGEYIGYVDADDYVELNMYERLYRAADLYHCDMIGSGCIREEQGKQKAIPDVLPLEKYIKVFHSKERKQLLVAGTSSSFATRIYRRAFLLDSQISFPERVLYEDNYWQTMILLLIQDYYICKESFYHYLIHDDSSTNALTQDKIMQSIHIQQKILEDCRERELFDPYYRELEAKHCKSCYVINLLTMYMEWHQIPEYIYRCMYEDIGKQFPNVSQNPYLWKSDIGLLEELFGRHGYLSEPQRNQCMQQYMDFLSQGRIQEWQPMTFVSAEAVKARWEDYLEACFLLSEHAVQLQQEGTFNDMIQQLMEEAKRLDDYQLAITYMEQMISRQGIYHTYVQERSPFLIYIGDDTCYHVLNDFALNFAKALERRGERVEYFDISQEPAGLLQYQGRHFKAMIGFQTWVFSVKLQDGTNLHDLIYGPKYNFIFDHPLWLKDHLENGPKDYYVLTHGSDYVEFVQRYFRKEIKACHLIPPAGVLPDNGEIKLQKEFPVTFIGTWFDYRERLSFIRNTKGTERYLANRFLLIMKRHPNLQAEDALKQALHDYQIVLNDNDFKELMFDLKQVVFCIMTYYREKVVRLLLENGLEIHVYGSSWKKSPMADHPKLICHAEVNLEESQKIWQQSKLSLNVMSWHKGGFTERIANMMLCKTVAVSDRSYYLEEHFEDGKELVLFDLEHLEQLPGRLQQLLKDDVLREKIAQAGYERAVREHTWDVRVEEFWKVRESII